jgi:hypothetical protein
VVRASDYGAGIGDEGEQGQASVAVARRESNPRYVRTGTPRSRVRVCWSVKSSR